MISIERSGHSNLEIEFILFDFEGTLAIDRRVHPKTKDKINLLSKRTGIYVFTTQEKELIEERLRKVKAEIIYLEEGDASRRKLGLLRQLGPTRCAAIGNGMDDAAMIQEAGIGICVIGREGSSGQSVKNADLVFSDILDALDFLLKPLRQKASLSL
ncbi:MAG: HAD family hydrolase [Thermodesulfobacteriota bacterium]